MRFSEEGEGGGGTTLSRFCLNPIFAVLSKITLCSVGVIL